MRVLHNKPAVKIVLPLIGGIVLGKYFTLSFSIVLFAALILLSICLITFYHRRMFIWTVSGFLILFGIARFQLADSVLLDDVSRFAELTEFVTVEGCVSGPVIEKEEKRRFVLQADSVWVLSEKFSCSGKVWVTIHIPSPVKYSDRVLLKGYLSRPLSSRNPGEFDYAEHLAVEGIRSVMSVRSSLHVMILDNPRGCPLWGSLVFSVRDFIIHFIDIAHAGQPAALLKGFLVGAREEIDPQLLQEFKNVGVIHVLAVSGLHVGFILAGLLGFFKLLRLSPGWSAILGIIGLIFYAFLTGLHAPVCRAALMASIVLLSFPLQRRVNVINSIALAAFILLVWNPLQLFHPGFQLSFVAVLGIVLLYNKLKRLFSDTLLTWRESESFTKLRVTQLFMVSLAAQIATIPLTAYYFSRFPIIAAIANLWVVPLVGLIVGLGFFCAILAVVYLPLTLTLAQSNQFMLELLIKSVQYVSSLPFSSWIVMRPSIGFMMFYFAAIAIVLQGPSLLSRRKAIVLFALMVIAIFLSLSIWQSKMLQVTFFDVVQGDATLFEFPDGKTMLVDAGDRNDVMDAGEMVIAPYLERNGIKTIDLLVLTHPHADHMGGAFYLLQHFRIRRIVGIPINDPFGLSAELDSVLAQKKASIRYLTAGDTLGGFGKCLMMVLHPQPSFTTFAESMPQGINNASIVLKVQYGARSFLLTGDAEKEAEQKMLQFGDLLSSDVWKVGHHGSATASSPEFRRKIGAEFAVISVARRNRFGLPNRQLLHAIEREGTQVLRTDIEGAVIFKTDGHMLRRSIFRPKRDFGYYR